jgi:hypothetical protein
VSIGDSAKYVLKSVSNLHKQGDKPNVFLFATARGGSTWVMEILASQAGMKYYDEPFNVRRDNVARVGLFTKWEDLMPDTDDPARVTKFLNDLVAGEYPFMNPPPFRPHHRLLTDRVVFKIHEMEHLIGRIARDCNGLVVYLLRHPVSTTLSRTVFPRLELFLSSNYYADAVGDATRLREIRRIGAAGTRLQKGVVSWCFENLIPLQRPDFDGLFVTYEELLLNPSRSCDLFMQRLQFDDRNKMMEAFVTPAANISMSSAETLQEMAKTDPLDRAVSLISRWQAKVTPDDRTAVTEIMGLFGLNIYSGASVLAHPSYLLFDDTSALLSRTRRTESLE